MFSFFVLFVSQTLLSLMLVVLGVLIVGLGYALKNKTKGRLLLHRWGMSVAVALAVGAVMLVMLPSAFNFFTDPNLQFPSPLSISVILHIIIGVPAITTGLIYAFGDLPEKTKFWMRWTALLWLAGFAVGILLFLQIASLLL